jgi:hypothetical protein
MSPQLTASRIESVLAVVLATAIAWSILCVEFLPSNDGPQHAFVGHVESHFLDEGAGWPAVYALNSPPTSNGYVDLFVLLEPLFGLNRAHQVTITTIVLLWAIGWFFWLRGEAGRGTFVPLLAFPCALQWALWIGIYPFLFSSALIPIALIIRRRWALSVPLGLVLSLLLVAMARVHVFGAALCGVVLIGVCLAEQRLLRSIAWTVVVGAPAFLYALSVSANSTMKSTAGAAWDVPVDFLDLFMEFFLPGPSMMQLLALVMFAAAAVTGIRADRRRQVFVALGLTLIGAGLILPFDWRGWEIVRPRLLPTGFMLLAGTAVVPRRLIAIAACAVLFFAGYRINWAIDMNSRAADELRPFIEITEGVDLRRKHWTYVVTDGPVSLAYDDLRYAGSLFHVAQMIGPKVGGAPFLSHDFDPTMHHLLVKPGARPWLGQLPDIESAWDPMVNRRLRDLRISTYFSLLSFLDNVMIYGLPGDADVLREAGYRVEQVRCDETGHCLFVGTFEGCSWNLHIDGLTEPTVVAIGFGVSADPRAFWPVDVDGALHIDDVPCGPAWFRVEARCLEERGDKGQVPVRPTDGVQDLHCHVP